MKAFLVAGVFFVAMVAVSAFSYGRLGESATEAYSSDSVRVGHDNAVDGRLGWAAEEAIED